MCSRGGIRTDRRANGQADLRGDRLPRRPGHQKIPTADECFERLVPADLYERNGDDPVDRVVVSHAVAASDSIVAESARQPHRRWQMKASSGQFFNRSDLAIGARRLRGRRSSQSSLTRVRPFFGALIARDPSGESSPAPRLAAAIGRFESVLAVGWAGPRSRPSVDIPEGSQPIARLRWAPGRS